MLISSLSCCRMLRTLSQLSKNNVKASTYALVYSTYGDPKTVLEKWEDNQVLSTKLENTQVMLQFLASPINPADINTVQGVYAVKPKLPAIGGNEGAARILQVGSGVTRLKVDDLVIPAQGGFGTWRTHAIAEEDDVLAVDSKLDPIAASMIAVNPCTAFRMLKDFVKVSEGESVIQNGANSAVGRNVIQLAKQWGIKTLNVVRAREGVDELKEELKTLGADEVITEEDLRNRDFMGTIWGKGIPKPNLALNCVGGKIATDCIRQLQPRGTMVTYGGMSRQPLIVPTGSLIFHDQKFCGYWMTRWNIENALSSERTQMLSDIATMLLDGKLKLPNCITVSLDSYLDGFDQAMNDKTNAKIVIKF